MAEKISTERSAYRVDVDWLGYGMKVEYQPRRTFGIESCEEVTHIIEESCHKFIKRG
jgi:hypothetical protein